MPAYDFQAIEQKWQAEWEARNAYAPEGPQSDKPKFYVLDMFPYPSGAGLHVGHPLGYIASDIVARYKRLQGYNVLHPMGFDAFGLPAEQYAIQLGVHPARSTEQNIATYKQQLKIIGLGYPPEHEILTSAPDYYKWTQWTFLQLFNAWFDAAQQKARPIDELIAAFEAEGSSAVEAAHTYEGSFSAEDWKGFSAKTQADILLHYRLAYLDETLVNWCPALGTVLANDEVKEGLSERGGHPVERRPMKQWSLRITAFAERLMNDLETLSWPESLVEMQRNWIGRSRGANIRFPVEGSEHALEVFTTRPDTIFGATFMVVAPEHELLEELLTDEQKADVLNYVEKAKNRSERERMADVKQVSGVFTGAYANHPLSGEQLPIWCADYVLAGYGTGAIMAVPAHDSRDHAFARHFGLPIVEVVAGGEDVQQVAFESKDEAATLVNSRFLDHLTVPEAIDKAIRKLEETGLGEGTTQYRLRDAIFSRQRYWGAPIPITYNAEGIPTPVPTAELPVHLPDLDDFSPTGTGESPLAKAEQWRRLPNGHTRETDTMPGWACSSWYFFRYTDPQNPDSFADTLHQKYWMNVDLYIGGNEHAVGHLLYARFYTKVLHDLGHATVNEPFQRLVNQGMIQGRSALAYRHKTTGEYVSFDLIEKKDLRDYTPIHVNVQYVEADYLDTEAIRQWLPEFKQASFRKNAAGKFLCERQVEKMSKRYHNVVNPDDICAQYGADTFRMYEMFLGPLEDSKPWNTDGISGVHNFLRKFWRLFFDEDKNHQWRVTDAQPTPQERKLLHQTIKKVRQDVEALSFNTAVSQFMIFTNEAWKAGCSKRAVLEPVVILLAPFAPHIAEELWQHLGHESSVLEAQLPEWDEEALKEDRITLPLQINGKVRAQLEVDANADKSTIEELARHHEATEKWSEGKSVRKVIVVPGKIVNVVVK